MTNSHQFLSPINPKTGGGAPVAGFTQVQEINGVKAWQTPDFARFKLIINYKSGANRKGYSQYFSIDYDDKTGQHNEMLGYAKLEKLVKSLTPQDYRIATIFANLTTDLSTGSRNYNHKVAIIRDGKYTFLRDIRYFEISDGMKKPKIKVHISETLKNIA